MVPLSLITSPEEHDRTKEDLRAKQKPENHKGMTAKGRPIGKRNEDLRAQLRHNMLPSSKECSFTTVLYKYQAIVVGGSVAFPNPSYVT